MSESAPEPISRRAARRAERGMRRETRRAVRDGRKTLKAAYAQAARDVKRMDPVVRERIGRATLTATDLQNLANYNVRDRFVPGQRWGDISQQLGAVAAGRLQRAGLGAGPTRNPFRQVAQGISRWRNTREGTKALKAAFTQAARDAKRMDPAVLASIGRSGINRDDLAAVARARFDQVFRPEGRFGAVPGQQLGQPLGQQVGQQAQPVGQQAQGVGSQLSVAQQVANLQQMIEAKQNQALQLMAEMNQLQTEMNQIIEARKAELTTEFAQLTALQQNQAQQTGEQVQTGQPVAEQSQPTPVPTGPEVQQPEAEEPKQTGEIAYDEKRSSQWMQTAMGEDEPEQEALPSTAGQETKPEQTASQQKLADRKASDAETFRVALDGMTNPQGSTGEQARQTAGTAGEHGQKRNSPTRTSGQQVGGDS